MINKPTSTAHVDQVAREVFALIRLHTGSVNDQLTRDIYAVLEKEEKGRNELAEIVTERRKILRKRLGWIHKEEQEELQRIENVLSKMRRGE